jgi:hypothetical protein
MSTDLGFCLLGFTTATTVRRCESRTHLVFQVACDRSDKAPCEFWNHLSVVSFHLIAQPPSQMPRPSAAGGDCHRPSLLPQQCAALGLQRCCEEAMPQCHVRVSAERLRTQCHSTNLVSITRFLEISLQSISWIAVAHKLSLSCQNAEVQTPGLLTVPLYSVSINLVRPVTSLSLSQSEHALHCFGS